MKRKIIQLIVTEMWNQQVLNALCDDGTVWFFGVDEEWHRMKPIPQDEPKDEKNDQH